MPISHFVDPDHRFVLTRCVGEVFRDEVEASLAKLREHPDFRPDFSQLADLSMVSSLKLGFNDLEAIHRLHDPFSTEGKRAVVAPGFGTTFGLARMYQSLVEHVRYEVFQSLLEAVAWLGLDMTIVEAVNKTKASSRNKKQTKKRQLASSQNAHWRK
jgi:hypothetical protein